jgi:RimJ/RimL family protein N-acetyltransferase
MRPGDAERLVAGRDDEFHRWMGAGSPEPQPSAVIEVDGDLAGWVDHDPPGARDWLEADACNVGYHVFASHRRRGIATRAVRLFLEVMATSAPGARATFLIDAENDASLAVARAVGAVEVRRFANAEGREQVLLEVSQRTDR